MEMFTVKRRHEVLNILQTAFEGWQQSSVSVSLKDALGRVLSEDIIAQENVPAFRRSTVDGYALIAQNTIGCSESLPAFLSLIGETEMGKGTELALNDYETVYVPTGGIVPEGANGVVMIEYTEPMGDEIAVNSPVSNLQNIVGIGDDVKENEMILSKNTVLKSQHIGALAALGVNEVKVLTKLKVGILSTGDELVAVDTPLKLGQIRDVNTHSLAAMIKSFGCDVVYQNRVGDLFDDIQIALKEAITLADVVLISGGSSVGTHDMTPDIINSLGKPGVLVHGIAIKPGKPTIVAKVDNTAVFGLPGHPASCIVSYKTVVEPFIQKTLMNSNNKTKRVLAKSGFQAHVSAGRDVFYMVTLEESENGYIANPVHGKSGMISVLSKADGYIEIPMEKEGLQKEDQVFVTLFRG